MAASAADVGPGLTPLDATSRAGDLTRSGSRAARHDSAAVAVFVKTPGFSPIKSRLALQIGAAAARRCYTLSLLAVRRAVNSAARAGKVQAYWAVAEASATDHWRGWPTVPQFGDDLGARMRFVYGALRQRHRDVLLLGGDVPTITADDLLTAANALRAVPQRVIARAVDGGFGLFGANVDLADSPWSSVPYGVPDTATQFLMRIAPEVPLLELLPVRDLDTYADLIALGEDRRVPGAVRRRLAQAAHECV